MIAEVADDKCECDEHEQSGQHPVEGARVHAGCPTGSEPGAGEAAGEQVHRDRPVRGDLGVGQGEQPGRERSDHHDQAHRFIEDDRVQGGETEHAEQHREPEFGAA